MTTTVGSSPHTRGPRNLGFCTVHYPGFIPACAGSTFFVSLDQLEAGDHPRMRGVHQAYVANRPHQGGSSPHARGPLQMFVSFSSALRIIPACAGSTNQETVFVQRDRDHPRMRGVHICKPCPPSQSLGSSPHARGPPANISLEGALARIIPACAGST